MGRGKNKKSYLTDLALFEMAGINPITGLSNKITPAPTYESARKMIKVMDEQNAVNRYRWFNVPCGLSSQEIERMLYYKFQLVFFRFPNSDRFYLMPFALDGTIDFYGRYNTVHPVPYSGGQDGNDKDEYEQSETVIERLSRVKLSVVYEILDEDEVDPNKDYGVILHDYTKGIGQNCTPRYQLQDAVIDAEAKIFPYLETVMVASSGVTGVRVNSADEQISVQAASKSIQGAALNGQPYVPIIGKLDFQELGSIKPATFQDYFLTLQSLDNFRLSAYGIDNGGMFQKKAHVLEDEEKVNGGPIGLVMQDGLEIRQRFCNIVNSIFDLGMWCELSSGESEEGGQNMAEEEQDPNVIQEGGAENEIRA